MSTLHYYKDAALNYAMVACLPLVVYRLGTGGVTPGALFVAWILVMEVVISGRLTAAIKSNDQQHWIDVWRIVTRILLATQSAHAFIDLVAWFLGVWAIPLAAVTIAVICLVDVVEIANNNRDHRVAPEAEFTVCAMLGFPETMVISMLFSARLEDGRLRMVGDQMRRVPEMVSNVERIAADLLKTPEPTRNSRIVEFLVLAQRRECSRVRRWTQAAAIYDQDIHVALLERGISCIPPALMTSHEEAVLSGKVPKLYPRRVQGWPWARLVSHQGRPIVTPLWATVARRNMADVAWITHQSLVNLVNTTDALLVVIRGLHTSRIPKELFQVLGEFLC